MQFVAHGPDIPEVLLQEHEEGRVVFFCGAGISYPAGLPGFKKLVEQIYQLNGTTFWDFERDTFQRGQFDATLDLLERRLPGQRLAVRRALAQALKPNLRRKGSTYTHAALLRLANNRQNELRLVTTNFDRVFHAAAKRMKRPFQEHAAPMLPIPKNSRWNGLVYLHGLLPDKTDDTALNRLVVTSGDFGLAYLTERWAARFVSELFRNYVVCFVGYSINDPVLRYMMDALAADRMLGEVTQQAWALGDYEPGKEHLKEAEWKAKGVTPILYEVPAESHDHSALHHTLHAWADTYRDGVQGKEAIVVKHAMARPQQSTQQDDFVGRMLWALSDKSGLPAKRFAEHNPVPPLDWLFDAFGDERFGHTDLARFGVPPHEKTDDKLRFSLIRRPASYDLASRMQLVSDGVTDIHWDNVMVQLARWLVRHLDDPRLVIWIAQHGGQLHGAWLSKVESELDRFTSPKGQGKTDKLDNIRSEASDAIPGPLMRTLWRLLLAGRVKSGRRDLDLYPWKDRLKREGVTATLRLELRELLAPQIVLTKPFHWGQEVGNAEEPTQIKQLVDWELVLVADHVYSVFQDLEDEYRESVLPLLLEDFQQSLRDALDLMRELGRADDLGDRSHWDLPSISPHWQNRRFRDWVDLIELLRDAWLAVRVADSGRATRIAQSWFAVPYPTFKRLALFAASQDDCIPPGHWVDWLLSDGSWWLWATDTGREVFRLFVLQGHRLAGADQERLEKAIMVGPPREMYRDDLTPEEWHDLVARSVWLHLAKLGESSLSLGSDARNRLKILSIAHMEWQLSSNERDEFSIWMSGTGDPDYKEIQVAYIAPCKRDELVKWLKETPPQQRWSEETWRGVCKKHPLNCLFALADLAIQDKWIPGRWSDALNAWSNEKQVRRMWRYAAPLVQFMPGDFIREISHSVAWWLEAASKSIDSHKDILLELCNRVLALPIEEELGHRVVRDGVESHDAVGAAINHPVGLVTRALINLWFKQNPNDGDLLPADIKPLFSKLCDVRVERLRHGRVVLGSQLIALFRVDRLWTEQNVLPLFSWDNPAEAEGVWQGFLWSPCLYQPLLTAFKPQFLESASHYSDLGGHRQQFARFLTYVALGPTEGYTVEDFWSAFKALPQDGLEESAKALSQALDGAADRREDFWKNRVRPFWNNVWPKSLAHATPRIVECLTRMVIAAGGEFPDALAAVEGWLKPIDHLDGVVRLLQKSGLCGKFPVESLTLLNAVIANQQFVPSLLRQCLCEVVQAKPQLQQDVLYQGLDEYARCRGQ